MKHKNTKILETIPAPEALPDEGIRYCGIEFASNKRFIELSQQLNEQTYISNKIGFIFSEFREYKKKEEYLICPVSRDIDGITYYFGLEVKDGSTAESIVDAYVRQELNPFGNKGFVGMLRDDMLSKLRECEGKVERLDLIHEYLSSLQGVINEMCSRYLKYQYAYTAEKLKSEHYHYPFNGTFQISSLPNEHFSADVLKKVQAGVRDRRIEVCYKQFLSDVENDVQLPLRELSYEELQTIPDGRGWGDRDIRDVELGDVAQVNGTSATKKQKPTTLFDLWQKNESHYTSVITHLKEESVYLGGAFVREVDGKLSWVRRHHKIQYLAGFIKSCIDRGFINDNSAPVFRNVLTNTFSITFDEKPFKPGELLNLKQEYMEPFKTLPSH